ncbi:GNAT family N-acetyltransferase [Vibrio japonicus]|uniref:GNAT family N-acetyltransferase n=1 Tax=Vibrio japonicus TaxID=1824638 RepID=A0ABY5LI08_9VIBR|nr:GNAT family N-acetyltransferase [Vibrio japonicus]UUM30458.1 GNAT family N-acetyltransferase [Vibrio japonicus]
MSHLTFETLDPIKLPLVSRLYKAHYPSGKAKKDELTVVAYKENKMVAVVRFRSVEHFRLLTGMLVIPECRAQGVGHELLNYCQQQILKQDDFCFAYEHLEAFYAAHGFETIAPFQLPNSLKMLYERYVQSGKKLIAMKYSPLHSSSNNAP